MPPQQKVDGRSERSRKTRARVVEAARQLFLEQGYVATTIESIAEHAGVAVQTVYYLFGTKRSVLASVLDATIVGDLEPVALADRAWVDDLRGERDAAAAVERLVAESVAIIARTMPIQDVIHRAAADPDVAVLLAEDRRRRRESQRALVELLVDAGHLDPTTDVDKAADVYYGLISPETFQLLVGDCDWDVARFRTWATDLLCGQFNVRSTRAGAGRRRRAPAG